MLYVLGHRIELQSFGKRSTEHCTVTDVAYHVTLSLNKQSGKNYKGPHRREGKGSAVRSESGPRSR